MKKEKEGSLEVDSKGAVMSTRNQKRDMIVYPVADIELDQLATGEFRSNLCVAAFSFALAFALNGGWDIFATGTETGRTAATLFGISIGLAAACGMIAFFGRRNQSNLVDKIRESSYSVDLGSSGGRPI